MFIAYLLQERFFFGHASRTAERVQANAVTSKATGDLMEKKTLPQH